MVVSCAHESVDAANQRDRPQWRQDRSRSHYICRDPALPFASATILAAMKSGCSTLWAACAVGKRNAKGQVTEVWQEPGR